MKIATAAYPLDFLSSEAQYEDKLARWVEDAATAGADMLIFPEYAGMELATLAGADVAGDLEQSLWAAAERQADADALHVRLAAAHDVHILAWSGPASVKGRPVNRARLITPDGQIGRQDKQIMTRFEAEEWDVVPGNGLQVFETALGKIGVLICYDCEFPLLGRALAACDVICVPSVTEATSGYWRVRIGAQARALEQQCFTIMSSVVGTADWSEALGTSHGRGGVFCPPDVGMPPDGVLALGGMNTPGWTFATLDLAQINRVRADGVVLNRRDWCAQEGRDAAAPIVPLREMHAWANTP